MQIILLVIHFAICIGIITLVLLQKSGGGALGIGGGQGGFMSTRGVATLLTRSTAVLGAALFINSLLLSSVMTKKGKSVFDLPQSKATLEKEIGSSIDKKPVIDKKSMGHTPVLPDLNQESQSVQSKKEPVPKLRKNPELEKKNQASGEKEKYPKK